MKQRSVRLWHKADMVFIIASSPDDWVSTHSIGWASGGCEVGQIKEVVMIVQRRRFITASAGFAAASALCRPAIAQAKKLHFGVGPLLPSPDDTKKAYAPVFAHLAKSWAQISIS